MGDRRVNLVRALAALRRLGTVEAISTVYETEPVGVAEQPEFWNLAVRLRTSLDPSELMRQLQRTEQRLGRRATFRHGPRVIDLDILLYEDQKWATLELEIPHPRLLERAFVLRPLLELSPDLRHPVTGELLRDRLSRGALEQIVPLFPGVDLLSSSNATDAQQT